MGKRRARQRSAIAARAAAVHAAPVDPEPRAVSSVPTSPGAGNARWSALLDLEKVARREARARRDRDKAVELARAAGASWAEIARALGVSRQAVAKRYGAGS